MQVLIVENDEGEIVPDFDGIDLPSESEDGQDQPMYKQKKRSVDVIFTGFVPHACNSGHE